jgi:hypothetical protein
VLLAPESHRRCVAENDRRCVLLAPESHRRCAVGAAVWPTDDLLHVLHVVPALPPYVGASLGLDGMIYSNLPLIQLQEAQVGHPGVYE